MRDSQSLLDQVISFSGKNITHEQVTAALGLVDRSFIYQMFKGIVSHDPDLCLEAIDQVYNSGYDLSEFSSELLELLRNATMVVLSPKSHRFLISLTKSGPILLSCQKRPPQMFLCAPFKSCLKHMNKLLDLQDQSYPWRWLWRSW